MLNEHLGYIKDDGNRTFSFHYEYRQTWDHKFNMQGMRAPGTYVKNFLRIKDEAESDCMLLILKYVLSANIATADQIARYIEFFGFKVEDLDAKLCEMVGGRLLNMFCLASTPLPEVPDDSLKFYCLDFGGKEILNHFGKNDLLDWLSINSIRSTELVNKYLTTNEFQISLLDAYRSAVQYFNSPVDLSIGSRFMRMSGEFRLQEGAVPRDFLLEVVRKDDLPLLFRNKCEKINELFKGKHIERYFSEPPTLIFMAENKEDAQEAAEIFHRMCSYDRFYLTTDAGIVDGMNDESFLRYLPVSQEIISIKVRDVL